MGFISLLNSLFRVEFDYIVLAELWLRILLLFSTFPEYLLCSSPESLFPATSQFLNSMEEASNIDDAMRAFVNNSSCSLVAACCCCRSTCAVRHDTCPRGGMLDWLSLLATSSWFNYRSQVWMVCECVCLRECVSVVFVSAGKCVLWHVNHPPLALSISGHDNWSCYHNFVAVAVAVARSWSRSPYQGYVSGSLAPSA